MREEGSDARVLQPQHAHIRSHSHLAQAIRMEIELVVYPVSEVLCERVFCEPGGSAQGGGATDLVNRLELLQSLAELIPSHEAGAQRQGKRT